MEETTTKEFYTMHRLLNVYFNDRFSNNIYKLLIGLIIASPLIVTAITVMFDTSVPVGSMAILALSVVALISVGEIVQMSKERINYVPMLIAFILASFSMGISVLFSKFLLNEYTFFGSILIVPIVLLTFILTSWYSSDKKQEMIA